MQHQRVEDSANPESKSKRSMRRGTYCQSMNQKEFNDILVSEFRKKNPAGKNCAERALNLYFATEGNRYTGSQFEYLVDSANPNLITPKDLLSVNSLSVDIPVRVSLWILSNEGQAFISSHLSQVPQDLEIWSDEAEQALGPEGPMKRIWDILKTAHWPQPREGNGLGGRTKRSKLLAAKRLHLIPVVDRVVKEVFPGVDDYWQAFRTALQNNEIRTEIELATASAPPHLSLLRKIDAVIWTSHTEDLHNAHWE
jgi:hypothetical protein